MKVSIKRLILNFIVIASLFTLFGCEDKNQQKIIDDSKPSSLKGEFTLKFSHVVSNDTPKGKAAIFFEKRLEELTNGRIDVQIYPSSQLSKDDAVLKALNLNTVQMAAPSFSKFSKVVPQLALFDLPFLFRDMEHIHKVQDGIVGEKLKKMVSSNGYIALDFWDNNFKQLSSSKKALISPDDAKEQNFRIMSSKVLEEQFEIIGAKTKVMPFAEVYENLKESIIDGQENTISNIYTKKFHEVQKYLTITNHGYLGYLVVISEEFWNSLPKELQNSVIQAMNEATIKEREYAKELNEKQFNLIKEYANNTKNLEIFYLTREQKDAWRRAVSKIYLEFYDENKIGENLIKGVLATE